MSHTTQQYHRVLVGISLLYHKLETASRQRATAIAQLTSSDSSRNQTVRLPVVQSVRTIVSSICPVFQLLIQSSNSRSCTLTVRNKSPFSQYLTIYKTTVETTLTNNNNKKQRHYSVNKGLSSQSYGFSGSHVWV